MSVLDKLRRPAEDRPVIDTSKPIRPEWMQNRDAMLNAARVWAWRNAYKGKKWTFHLPAILCLLVLYSPRGLGRLVAMLSRYLYVNDSAELQAQHASDKATAEYVKVEGVRRSKLKARWMVFSTIAVVVVCPLLAWTFPVVLSGILGVAVFVWIIKLIPGRGMREVIVALAAGAAVFWFGPGILALIPHPSAWWCLLAIPADLALGWIGRPEGKRLAPDSANFAQAGVIEKPTADMITEALSRIGLPGMTMDKIDRVRDEIRIQAPGVATSANGYTIELELPPGRTAEEVVGKRSGLAGALRRDLGCVWPSGNEERHPGYLRLFLSHKPMNKGKQPAWTLAAGKPVDVFEPLPLFTDEEMRWVCLTIAGTHTAVGGASGFGKSVWLRQLACALAFDLRVRLYIFDGKRSGDFEHVRKLAHAYHEGAEDHEIAAQIAELEDLIEECLRRAKFLKDLPPEERSPKVTSALASKYPKQLAPIVLIYDEVQEGTEYGVKGNRDHKAIRDQFAGLLTRLARIARSAGIFMVLASQKPDAGVLPSSIMGNCGIRIAFKVSEQTHNDQILGTSARKNGIDATMFGSRDRGMAWLKGGDAVDAQVVRSWSEMVDVNVGIELADKAYELRRAAGMLTGQAAGEEPEPKDEVDFLADCRTVMDAVSARAISLDAMREALILHRPITWGPLDNDGVGGLLRGEGIEPRSIHCSVRGKTAKGIRREWLDGPVVIDGEAGAA